MSGEGGMSGTGVNETAAGETDKESPTRRVYVLPSDQVEQIRAYQARNGISSEVEAVRRLLDIALQMRDTVPDLLKKLKSKFATEKDLRILARDVLATHALVKTIAFEDNAVSFTFTAEDRGRISSSGQTYIAESGASWDDWSIYPDPRREPRGGAGPSWDAPKGGDLDDEIPF
jgi:predicted RNA-binding Zn ribbon-like protein